MNIKNMFMLLVMSLLLSGCSITYNLDISKNGLVENIEVLAHEDDGLLKYEIPAYFGDIGYEDVDTSILKKIDGISYYNSKYLKNDNLIKLKYDYEFNEDEFSKSNIVNFSYSTFIFKRYDHDVDGVNDYMLFTTDDDFILFNKFPKLKNVQINITCHYEVISSNADVVNRNVYTWYLDKNNIKPINIVYNPDNPVDYRTFLEKLKEGEFTNIFTISIILLVIGGLVYFIIKKKSVNGDKI